MKIVIAGGGVAAFEAANSARKFSPDAEITVVSSEKLLPYRRPALSGMLGDFKINEKAFFIKPDNFYAEQRIALRLNTRCVAISKNSITLDDNSVLEFDRLIIATGGAACRPPLTGADLPNVYTFRDFADLEVLDNTLKNISSALVIGCGVLGLELAESMIKRNIRVTMLERMPRIFAGKLPEAESAEVEATLKNIPQLELNFNCSVKELTPKGALLSDGRFFPADIIIFSAGSRPVFPEFLGVELKVDRGIIVDEKMQTSEENIFAAGDAAQLDERVFGLYNDARTTGMIAGTNAAGGDASFSAGTASPVRCFCFGLRLVMP